MTNAEILERKLLEEYRDDCNDIADECVMEGYPSHGSNYELRCEDLWNRFYKEEYEALLEEEEES